MTAAPKKCAHSCCGCTVADGKKYCSQLCEDSKSYTELTCHCGHEACSAKQP